MFFSLEAKEKLNITGSSLAVTDALTLNAAEINITAGVEESSSHSSSHTTTTGVSVSTSGAKGFDASQQMAAASGGLNASTNSSESDSYSKTHIHSLITAGSLNSNSERLNIIGGDVEIQNDINITTKELTIASVQDESRSSSSSSGFNVSGSVGGASSIKPSSVGGSYNESNSDSKWVNNQSSLIGGLSGNGAVTITADKTVLTGALLASATRDETGTLSDNGNLNLTTDVLEVNNLYDHNTSDSRGINLSLGTSSSGSSTLGLNHSGHNTEQTSFATLGGGTVQKKDGTAHDVSAVNSDLNTTQEITQDQDTGGLDASFTLDHRLLTEKGQAEIQKTFIDTIQHGKEIAKAAEEVASTDESVLSFFGKVDDYATERKVLAAQAASAEEQKKLRGDAGAAGSEEGLQNLSNALSQAQGLAEGADVALYDGSQLTDDTLAIDKTAVNKTKVEGAYHQNGNGIYVNIDNTDMTNSTDTVSTLVHEQTRHRLAQEGQMGSLSRDDQTTIAINHAERAGEVWDAYSGLAGISTQGNNTQANWNNANRNSSNVQQGTQQIAAINNNELKARQLNLNEASMLDTARAKIAASKLTDAQKKVRLEKLNALACAEVKCAAGVSPDDPLYAKLKGLQDAGDAIKAKEGQDIGDMLGSLGVSTIADEKYGRTGTLTKKEEQFQYDRGDAFNDGITSHEKGIAQVQAGVQIAGGVAGVVGGSTLTVTGAATCPALAGCAVAAGGVAVTGLGMSEIKEGVETLREDHAYTSGQRVVDSFSAESFSGEHNPVADLAAQLALTGAESVAAKVGLKQAGKLYDKYVEGNKSLLGNNGSASGEGDFGYLNQETPRVSVASQSSQIELSNGIIIDANPDKTTTVLGKYDYQGSGTKEALEILDYPKTYDIGEKEGGFNLLNIPDAPASQATNFWEEYNKPLLDEAVRRGDDFAVITIPTASSKGNFVNEFGPVGMYGKELEYLVEKQVKPVNLSDTDWNMVKEWFQKE